jgi:hypothetical protein
MSSQEFAQTGVVAEPDVVFLDSLEISGEPALRKLEVYREARHLRDNVQWLDEEYSLAPRTPVAAARRLPPVQERQWMRRWRS